MASKEGSRGTSPTKQLPRFPHGIDLIDFNILQQLEDEQLFETCKSDKYLAKLCNDPLFWRTRLNNKFRWDLPMRASTSGVEYKGMYITLMPYFDNLVKMAQMTIKHGYIEILEQILNYERFKHMPRDKYATGMPLFHIYSSAISEGSVDAMLLVEKLHKPTRKDLIKIFDNFDLCQGVSPKSLTHLTQRYKKKSNVPKELDYLVAASGDIKLLKNLQMIDRKGEISLQRRYVAAVISGSLQMVEYIKEISQPDVPDYETGSELIKDTRDCKKTESFARAFMALFDHFDETEMEGVLIDIMMENEWDLIDQLSNIGVDVDIDMSVEYKERIFDEMDMHDRNVRLLRLILPEMKMQLLDKAIIDEDDVLLSLILELVDITNTELFALLEACIKNGQVGIFEILWDRVHDKYPEDIFGLLIESLVRGVNAEAIATMIRIVKKTQKMPAKLVQGLKLVLKVVSEDM